MAKSTKKTKINTTPDKIDFWEKKLRTAASFYEGRIKENEDNYAAYKGTRDIFNSQGQKSNKQKTTVRKVTFELVEAQVDTTIPQPKVTSVKGMVDRAQTIEHYIKNELDRLPFEEMNDEQERTTKITGSSIFLVEWDNSVKTRNTIGKLKVSNIHPNDIVPQPGVDKLEDMDYIFLRLLESKLEIKQRYGIDVEEESNTEPDKDKTHNDELVTHYYCYYKNKDGYISLFSWVNNSIVQDIDNYFARKIMKCDACGASKTEAETCSECGKKKFTLTTLTTEELEIPVGVDEAGQPMNEMINIDYYIPKVYPFVMIKNASEVNEFLGSSDVGVIKDQQNDLNIYTTKIREKLLKGGSLVTLPEDVDFKANDDELKVVRLKGGQQASQIGTHSLQPAINNDVILLDKTYEHARQTIGITDSFQGRRDTTAVSGKAKEFAAAQSAGRLESKRTMKNFAYSQLYNVMFQFILAYADEPRHYSFQDDNGNIQYKMFDKRVFIDKDNADNYYYDDEFIFSVDESAVLSTNRRAMWEETRLNFTSGAYGNPEDLQTILMFWQMMDVLHYPGAKPAMRFASERVEAQQQMMAEQAEMAQVNAEQQMAVDAFGKMNRGPQRQQSNT